MGAGPGTTGKGGKMGGKVIVERDGAVATVTLSNPAKKNALKPEDPERVEGRRWTGSTEEGTRCLILPGEWGRGVLRGVPDIQHTDPAGGERRGPGPPLQHPFDDMIRAIGVVPPRR